MRVNLDKLKILSTRLVVERKSLIENLVAIPASEKLPGEVLQRLADVSVAAETVSREIAAQEPHLGWG
jgi:hypothetical protein